MNEKALLKLMKAAYKGGGLRVAREVKTTDRLILRTGAWAVSLPVDAVPGKVLGLLAEWMHGLPLIGESWLLLSGEEPEQKFGPDTVMETLQQDFHAGRYAEGMKPAGLTTGDREVFQLLDGNILLFGSDLVDLVRGRSNMGLYDRASETAFWQDEETGAEVWICPSHSQAGGQLMEHLSRYDFWKEGRHEPSV